MKQKALLRGLSGIIFLYWAGPSVSQDWNIRPWDMEMQRDELIDRVVGQDIEFMDGGLASYSRDGSYAYTYKSGRSFSGKYTINEDASVCVTFDNGPKRCDLYVLHDERLVMIAETGRRFPTAP